MDKYTNNEFVEPLDAIILLNDNYASEGLKKGYIGTVMDNCIPEQGVVIADFMDPIGNKPGVPVAVIKKEDFRVLSGSKEDKAAVKRFRDMFR